MNFEGKNGTVVNHSMITSKWLADEFPKKGPSKSLKSMENLFAKHNLACFLHMLFISMMLIHYHSWERSRLFFLYNSIYVVGKLFSNLKYTGRNGGGNLSSWIPFTFSLEENNFFFFLISICPHTPRAENLPGVEVGMSPYLEYLNLSFVADSSFPHSNSCPPTPM